MLVPGANLLNMASRVIAQNTWLYYAYTRRIKQQNGNFLTDYGTPVEMLGSFQPIPRNLYERMGLSLQGNYVNFFTQHRIQDVERDVAGDQILFQGKTYEALSKTPWFGIDGWDAIMAVEVLAPRNQQKPA